MFPRGDEIKNQEMTVTGWGLSFVGILFVRFIFLYSERVALFVIGKLVPSISITGFLEFPVAEILRFIETWRKASTEPKISRLSGVSELERIT